MTLDSLAGPATIDDATHDGAGNMDLINVAPYFGETIGAVGKWLRDTASIGAAAYITYALVNAAIQKWRERPLVVHHAYVSERKTPGNDTIVHLRVQIFNRMAQPLLFRGLQIVAGGEARFLQTNKLVSVAGRQIVRPEFVRGDGLLIERRHVIEPFVPGATHFPSAEITAEIGPVAESQGPLKVRAIFSAMPESRLIRSKTVAVAVVTAQ